MKMMVVVVVVEVVEVDRSHVLKTTVRRWMMKYYSQLMRMLLTYSMFDPKTC
jgi:hypothetical protein